MEYNQTILTFGDFLEPNKLQGPGIYEGVTLQPITFGEGFFEIPYVTADNQIVSNRV